MSQIEESGSELKDRMATWFARGLVALILLNVAVQMVSVNVGTLSRWQGGGFGMYTDTHPFNRTVTIRSGTGDILYHHDNVGFNKRETHEALIRLKSFPTESRASRFFAALTDEQCFTQAAIFQNPICRKGFPYTLAVRDVKINMGDMTIDRDVIFSGKVVSND